MKQRHAEALAEAVRAFMEAHDRDGCPLEQGMLLGVAMEMGREALAGYEQWDKCPSQGEPRMVRLSDAWDYAHGHVTWNDLESRSSRPSTRAGCMGSSPSGAA